MNDKFFLFFYMHIKFKYLFALKKFKKINIKLIIIFLYFLIFCFFVIFNFFKNLIISKLCNFEKKQICINEKIIITIIINDLISFLLLILLLILFWMICLIFSMIVYDLLSCLWLEFFYVHTSYVSSSHQLLPSQHVLQPYQFPFQLS